VTGFRNHPMLELRRPEVRHDLTAALAALDRELPLQPETLVGGEGRRGEGETSTDPKLKTLFPDPAAEAAEWYARHGVVPVNHLVVVTEQLAKSHPDVVSGIYDLLKQNKAQAGPAATPDLVPFGIEANRKPLELIVDYAFQQALIPRRYAVEELFDETTRGLN